MPYAFTNGDPVNLTDVLGLASHFSNRFRGWSQGDFDALSCDELMAIINGLIDELRTRDVDFQQNKLGSITDGQRYIGHLFQYAQVQDFLEMATQAHQNNGCDLSADEGKLILHWETKRPSPSGHPGTTATSVSIWTDIAHVLKNIVVPHPEPIPEPALP